MHAALVRATHTKNLGRLLQRYKSGRGKKSWTIVKPTRQWLALPSGFTRCNGPETFFFKKRKTRYSPRSSLGEQSECTARKKCESGAQKRFAVFGRLATLSLFSVSDPGESGNRKLGGFGPDHTNKGERERKEPGVEGSQWGRDAGRARSHPGRY
jgi:hypothetical protein